MSAYPRLREAIGDEVALMVDANHAYDATDAIALGRKVEELDIGWFEEPVAPEDHDGYREVSRRPPIPVAGGEAVHALGLPRAAHRARASTSSSPISAPPAASRNARRSPTWRRPSACATCRIVGHGYRPRRRAAAPRRASAQPARPHATRAAARVRQLRAPVPRRGHIEPIEQEHGFVRVPTGPGLGVEVDRAALERFRA